MQGLELLTNRGAFRLDYQTSLKRLCGYTCPDSPLFPLLTPWIRKGTTEICKHAHYIHGKHVVNEKFYPR